METDSGVSMSKTQSTVAEPTVLAEGDLDGSYLHTLQDSDTRSLQGAAAAGPSTNNEALLDELRYFTQ